MTRLVNNPLDEEGVAELNQALDDVWLLGTTDQHRALVPLVDAMGKGQEVDPGVIIAVRRHDHRHGLHIAGDIDLPPRLQWLGQPDQKQITPG